VCAVCCVHTALQAWSLEKVELLDGRIVTPRGGGGSSSGRGGGGGDGGGGKRGGSSSKGSVWKACYSSKRQKTFYVNRLTEERSWHKPDDYDGD